MPSSVTQFLCHENCSAAGVRAAMCMGPQQRVYLKLRLP